MSPGATVKVVNLTISVGEDGTVSGSASLQVSLNMCPTWLTIAARHILDAVDAENRLRRCHEEGDEAGLGAALLDQANAGMQAIVASCATTLLRCIPPHPLSKRRDSSRCMSLRPSATRYTHTHGACTR